MFNTKNQLSDIKQVPAAWIFSHYCKVPIERFDGSDFKINSVLSTQDKTPSMSFYVTADDSYKFNDFSSGLKGGGVQLVMDLFKLSYFDARNKIISDYNSWINDGGVYEAGDIEQKSKFKVAAYEVRGWTTLDRDFYIPYNIGSKILERFFVKPLSSYLMRKDSEEFTVAGNHIYGYFTASGELYKIYQPYSTHKFTNVRSYTQGSDQLKGQPYLIYTSSLKDIMCLSSYELSIDYKAPPSENTIISKEEVEKDKQLYKRILVFFDNDEAGIKAAQKYKELYDIDAIFLNYGYKDPSDHTKHFGPQKVFNWLVPLINKKLNP